MILTDKFIAFIDILGFKELVTKAETGAGVHQRRNLEFVQ